MALEETQRTSPWSTASEPLCRSVWVSVFWHTASYSKWSKWLSPSSNRRDRHLRVPSSVSSIHRRVDLKSRRTERSFLDCNGQRYPYVHRQRSRCHEIYCFFVRSVWYWSCNLYRIVLPVYVFSPWCDRRETAVERATQFEILTAMYPPHSLQPLSPREPQPRPAIDCCVTFECPVVKLLFSCSFLLTLSHWFEYSHRTINEQSG